MTDLLELVPAFRRQVGVYTHGTNTVDSALAGYLFDAIQALMSRWDRTYELQFISPATYIVTPDIVPQDVRPIILMASIIYKSGSLSVVSFTDGDFTWNARGASATILADRNELLSYVPGIRLAQPIVGTMFGYKSVYNPESYSWWDAAAYVWGY